MCNLIKLDSVRTVGQTIKGSLSLSFIRRRTFAVLSGRLYLCRVQRNNLDKTTLLPRVFHAGRGCVSLEKTNTFPSTERGDADDIKYCWWAYIASTTHCTDDQTKLFPTSHRSRQHTFQKQAQKGWWSWLNTPHAVVSKVWWEKKGRDERTVLGIRTNAAFISNLSDD